jgi:hypothetical protein
LNFCTSPFPGDKLQIGQSGLARVINDLLTAPLKAKTVKQKNISVLNCTFCPRIFCQKHGRSVPSSFPKVSNVKFITNVWSLYPSPQSQENSPASSILTFRIFILAVRWPAVKNFYESTTGIIFQQSTPILDNNCSLNTWFKLFFAIPKWTKWVCVKHDIIISEYYVRWKNISLQSTCFIYQLCLRNVP